MMSETTHKTMKDLREYVGGRLRDALHGKEVDMMQPVKPRLEHMLGLVEIGEVMDPSDIDGSILDSRHEFWDDYYETVNTRNEAQEQVISAVEGLETDGLFEMSYPYGEEAGIIYVEVEDPNQYNMQTDGDNTMKTSCKSCGHTLLTPPRLMLYNGYYYLKFSLDCENCGFTGSYRAELIKE
jgi:hypothetical protein